MTSTTRRHGVESIKWEKFRSLKLQNDEVMHRKKLIIISNQAEIVVFNLHKIICVD